MPVNPARGGGGGGGSGANRFYLSTAPPPAAGIYTDINKLMAALSLLPSSEVREIFVLDSLTLDEKTDATGWDFRNVSWLSTGLPGSVVVTTPPGFFCDVPPLLFKDIAFVHGGNQPFWATTDVVVEWVRLENASIESSSGQPIIHVDSGGSYVLLSLDDGSSILKGSGPAGTRIYVGDGDTVQCTCSTGFVSEDILETAAPLLLEPGGMWRQTNYTRDAAANVTYDGQVGLAPGTLTVDNLAAQWRFGPAVVLAAATVANDVDVAWGELVPLNVGAGASLTGITGGVDGRQLVLQNTSSVPLVLLNDVGSIAANRIYTEGRVPFQSVPPYGSVELVYSGTVSRWLVQGRDQGTERHTSATTLTATTITQHSLFLLAAGATIPNLTADSAGTTIRIVSTDLVNPMDITLLDNGVPGAGWVIALSPGGGGTFIWSGAIWQCIGNT